MAEQFGLKMQSQNSLSMENHFEDSKVLSTEGGTLPVPNWERQFLEQDKLSMNCYLKKAIPAFTLEQVMGLLSPTYMTKYLSLIHI